MPTNDSQWYKEYYQRNRERLRAVRRAWYLKNREQILATQKSKRLERLGKKAFKRKGRRTVQEQVRTVRTNTRSRPRDVAEVTGEAVMDAGEHGHVMPVSPPLSDAEPHIVDTEVTRSAETVPDFAVPDATRVVEYTGGNDTWTSLKS